MNSKVNLWVSRVVFALFLLNVSAAHADSNDPGEVFGLDLEQLMDIEVYSASKKKERMADAAAAVHVISSEDIRRSGATTIAELLRMVPGVHVARFNQSTWSVGVRGFNGRLANKLLVLVDGRSVYNHIFSGTYWNEVDTMIEDIDRIEVIRGPGGTLWGANAVNGVINIITKKASDTVGGVLTAGGGNVEQAFSGVRYGAKIGENGHARAYAKVYRRGRSRNEGGGDAFDEAEAGFIGMKAEWELSERDHLTVQGDMYNGDGNEEQPQPSSTAPFMQVVRGEDRFNGGNILARWDRTISDDSEMNLQFYYMKTERTAVADGDGDGQSNDTIDFDFQHRFQVGSRNELIWGIGYRSVRDDLDFQGLVDFVDMKRSLDLYSAFIQDELTIVPDKLRLIFGTKLEKNDFTDYEIQPNARIAWTPDKKQTVWASVSRAIRTPSRVNDDVSSDIQSVPIPGPLGVGTVRVLGDRGSESEDLLAYEAGYRVAASDRLSFDLTAFVFDYDDLLTIDSRASFVDTSSGIPRLILPLAFRNAADAKSHGVELVADLKAADWWRLQGTYSYYHLNISLDDDVTSQIGLNEEEQNPENQFTIRSMMNLSSEVELDGFLRYVDRLSQPDIDAYMELDARLAWRAMDDLTIEVVGQNLLDNAHIEFNEAFPSPSRTELRRGVYG